MLKKIFAAIVFVGLCGAARAGAPVYTDNLVTETGLAYSKNYDVDLNNKAGSAVNQLSMQATYSSATIAAVAFTDGSKSTATITVASNSQLGVANATNTITVAANAALAPQAAHATITVVTNSALSGAFVVMNGAMYVEGRDWTKGTTSTATAISLATVLNRATNVAVSTTSDGTVISASSTIAGLSGNTYTLATSTPTALSVSGANFAGGTNDALLGAIITVNGATYANGIAWNSFDPVTGLSVSTRAAISIAALFNNITGLAASSVGSVVYATATIAGSAGNAFTMSDNRAALTTAGANFSGGRSTASISIDGVTLRNGVDWTAGSTSSATAKSISDAIMANATLNVVMVSTWNANGVVYATSTVTGTAANFPLASLTSALTTTGFAGGGPTSIDLTANTITVANNHLTTALPVLYTKSAGTSPTPLVAGTTYYPVIVNANAFQLSDTSTGAIAGLPLDITAQTAAGGGSFLLTPLAISGTPSFKWQESNDGTNFVDVGVSSVTFSSPYTAATTFWDFGQVNMRWLRLKFTGPTTGGVAIAVKPNGKG